MNSEVLEVALLQVIPGQESDFERAFAGAKKIIEACDGFLGLELRRCVERPDGYLLLVRWRRLEDHTIGFRLGPTYPDWKRLLHHFYDPFPTVEHYEQVDLTGA